MPTEAQTETPTRYGPLSTTLKFRSKIHRARNFGYGNDFQEKSLTLELPCERGSQRETREADFH